MSSIKPVFSAIMLHIFNCYKEHGYRIVLMYHLSLTEKFARFAVISPDELEDIEKEYKIIRDVERFQEIPETEYKKMAQKLTDSLL